MDNGRQASIANLEGSLILSGSARPDIGFRAEAIVLSDSATGMTGRAVWTDEHGDRIFSELHRDGPATTTKIIGDFLGGTGRYLGVRGTYEFSWEFLLPTEDGLLQGQSAGLQGWAQLSAATETRETGSPVP